jgi:hypothetical protein
MSSYEKAKAEAIRRSHQKWGQTRLRGRGRYIWSRGVFMWGGLMAFSFCLGQLVAGRSHPLGVLATVAMCAVSGYFIGVIKWKHNEAAYLTGWEEEIE